MIQVASFVFNDFQENTYVLFDETGECVIIDPGCYKASEQKELIQFIDGKGLKPVKLLNTHCHIDHVLGNAYVADKYDLSLYMHRDEIKTYQETGRWADMFGMVVDEMPDKKVFVDEGDVITFGKSELQIAFTPGHSIASITFYNLAEKFAIAGDVLFYESIGRTDLPGGNFETLASGIRNKLFVWPDEMKIYPGHGPVTTIGHEKMHNPFL